MHPAGQVATDSVYNSPGQEGPNYAPPPLPEGWIAQWDGMSKKYYFVQMSTGSSTWETPTHAAPTGPTPQATPNQELQHPYGMPSDEQRDLDIVQNPDGTQSVRGPDGKLEPYSGERGIGSFVMNQYMHKQSGGHSNQQSNGLMGLATSMLGGGKTHQGSSSGGGSAASGIVGALAGSLLGGKKQNNQQQANYSGAPQQQHSSGMMGSLGGMFGGHQSSSVRDFFCFYEHG